MSRTLRPALAASLFVLLAVPALAQRTTGGISGTVKDSTGAMLPGVTVSVSGPAIVGTQTATTNEIARSVNEAASGATGIAEDITRVASATTQAQSGAQGTSAAAGELAGMATALDGLVGAFRY